MYSHDCQSTRITSSFSKHYQDQGIVYLKNYFSESKCKTILTEIDTIADRAAIDLETQWNGERVCFVSSDKSRKQSTDDFAFHPYFQASRDKSHVFYENHLGGDRINRIGHALHKESTSSELSTMITPQLLDMLKTLEYRRPVCHLSVYIPKYPNNVGSKVRPHQENTFAYTTPNSAIVLWVALEKASIENACMWGIPGSHRWPLKYRSQVDRDNNRRDFVQLNDVYIPDFESERAQYVPLEVEAGDALLFHGNFVHCSEQNTSSQSRRCLSLQFLETFDTTYHDCNWLMPARSDYLYDLAEYEKQ